MPLGRREPADRWGRPEAMPVRRGRRSVTSQAVGRGDRCGRRATTGWTCRRQSSTPAADGSDDGPAAAGVPLRDDGRWWAGRLDGIVVDGTWAGPDGVETDVGSDGGASAMEWADQIDPCVVEACTGTRDRTRAGPSEVAGSVEGGASGACRGAGCRLASGHRSIRETNRPIRNSLRCEPSPRQWAPVQQPGLHPAWMGAAGGRDWADFRSG